MKAPLIPALLALAVLAVAPASAQDACTQADPCPWSVDIGPAGFDDNTLGGTFFNGTAADWHQFEFFNADERAHTVTVDGYGLSWTIDALQTLTSQPFELATTGRFVVRDSPSGDTAQMNVGVDDVVDGETQGEQQEEDGNGAPGLPAWTLIALVALATAARRPR